MMEKTFLPLNAVEAMVKDKIMSQLLAMHPRTQKKYLTELSTRQTLPDWALAGLNCTDIKNILPFAIHTYLLDWRPE